MMKITVENIGGLKGTHKFTFDKKLNVLNAPNAVGKSSLLKGIYLTLCGEFLDDEELKKYLTDRENNGTVRIEFDDGRIAEISLIRKQTGVEIIHNSIPDEWKSDATVDLLLMNFQSELFYSLVRKDKDAMEVWIKGITKVAQLDSVFTYSFRKLGELKNKRDTLKKRIKEETKMKKTTLEEKQKELSNVIKEIDKIENSADYKQFQENEEETNKNIVILETQKESLNEDIDGISYKKENIDKDILLKEKQIKNLNRRKEIAEEKQGIYNLEYPTVKSQYDDLTAEIGKLNTKYSKKFEELKSYNNEYEKIKKISGFEKCPTCDQKLDKEKIKENEKKIKDNKAALESETNLINTEIKKKQAAQKEKKKQMDRLTNDLVKITKEEEKERTTADAEIVKYKKESKTLGDAIKGKKDERTQIEVELKKIREAKGKEYPIVKKLQGQKDAQLKISSTIDALKDEINKNIESENEIKQVEIQIARAEKISKYYSNLIKERTVTFVENINNGIKESFDLLSLAKLKRIDMKQDTYLLDIEREDGMVTDIDRLSGAETAVIFLIIFYTIKRIVLPEVPILLIDEITSEIDDYRFKEILKYISKEVDYIIVARHIPFDGKRRLLAQSDVSELE